MVREVNVDVIGEDLVNRFEDLVDFCQSEDYKNAEANSLLIGIQFDLKKFLDSNKVNKYSIKDYMFGILLSMSSICLSNNSDNLLPKINELLAEIRIWKNE